MIVGGFEAGMEQLDAAILNSNYDEIERLTAKLRRRKEISPGTLELKR